MAFGGRNSATGSGQRQGIYSLLAVVLLEQHVTKLITEFPLEFRIPFTHCADMLRQLLRLVTKSKLAR